MKLRSPKVLWTLLALQVACTLFFVLDSLLDVLGMQDQGVTGVMTQVFEYGMTLVLVGSVAFTIVSLRALAARERQLQRQVDAASGAFEAVMDAQFKAWGLTPSETDVARLAIKGMSIQEMAALRGSKEGTIKAHSAAVYRKAGVKGRLQLISLFVEELMSDPVLPRVRDGED